MTEANDRTPDNELPPEESAPLHEETVASRPGDAPPASAPAGSSGAPEVIDVEAGDEDDRMAERLERLGGEPAPAISPEEFVRLQQSGQIHIDSRGRIRTSRREQTDAGMSLRKRRAWYR